MSAVILYIYVLVMYITYDFDVFSLLMYILAPHISSFRGGGNYTMRTDILHDLVVFTMFECFGVNYRVKY